MPVRGETTSRPTVLRTCSTRRVYRDRVRRRSRGYCGVDEEITSGGWVLMSDSCQSQQEYLIPPSFIGNLRVRCSSCVHLQSLAMGLSEIPGPRSPACCPLILADARLYSLTPNPSPVTPAQAGAHQLPTPPPPVEAGARVQVLLEEGGEAGSEQTKTRSTWRITTCWASRRTVRRTM
jgi:hypothetical protein